MLTRYIVVGIFNLLYKLVNSDFPTCTLIKNVSHFSFVYGQREYIFFCNKPCRVYPLPSFSGQENKSLDIPEITVEEHIKGGTFLFVDQRDSTL